MIVEFEVNITDSITCRLNISQTNVNRRGILVYGSGINCKTNNIPNSFMKNRPE